MAVKTIETRTCEICGAEKVIDWGKTDDLREARKGWGSISLMAHGNAVDGGGFYPDSLTSQTVCPSAECVKSAFEDLLETLNTRLREEFEKTLAQPVEQKPRP